MRYTAEQKAESLAALRRMCKPGTVIYTMLRHVSKSGMMRHISLYVIGRDRKPVPISWHVAHVLGAPLNDGRQAWALKVSGCGMDMGFHVVNSLSYALHGMKPRGEGAAPDAQGRPFRARPGHYRAGYSLNHEWL